MRPPKNAHGNMRPLVFGTHDKDKHHKNHYDNGRNDAAGLNMLQN